MLRATIYLFGVLFACFVAIYNNEPRLGVWFRKNLDCARGLLEHKYYVFKAGRLLKVPLWRLLVHDWTRVLPIEWRAYTKSRESLEGYRAWTSHVTHNGHHWQHWCTDKEEYQMSEVCVREMVADWMAVTRVTGGTYGAVASFKLSNQKMRLHPETRNFVWFLLYTYAVQWEGKQ